MPRKIVHGNANFGYATIDFSGDTPAFGTPTMLPGMVSCSAEVEQSDDAIYADNIVWVRPRGAKVRSAEVAFRYITDDYMQLLSFKKNANGLMSDTNIAQPHAFFFEEVVEDGETGATTQRLHIFYNAVGGEPNLESTTDEDGVEAREISVEYTCSPSTFVVDDAGEYCQYAYLERNSENATLYDTFKQAIITPSSGN